MRQAKQEHLFPDSLVLQATISWSAGKSQVDQCSWCGTLVCHDMERKLGPCPACGTAEWWTQQLPVGPFQK